MLTPPAPAAADEVQITLLGGFRVDFRGREVRLTSSGQRLLALLALHGATTRAVAASTLWADTTDTRAHGSLRTTLWRLNRLGAPLVLADRDRLALAPRAGVDLHSFVERARALVRRPLADGDLDLAAVLGGELLPGWPEEWVLTEREQLRQLRLHAVEALGWHLSRHGRYAAAIEAGLVAIQLDPLRESAHRLLISVHLCEHNVAEATRLLRSFRLLLHRELGVEPSAELTALLPQPTAHHDAAPAGMALRRR